MTYYDAWIGPPDDIACLADGKNPETHQPPGRISPWFPGSTGSEVYYQLRTRIQAGRMLGAQTDWGSWAALVTRAEIEAFIEELFGPPGKYEEEQSGGLEHLAQQMRELRSFIASLPADAKFALAADEF